MMLRRLLSVTFTLAVFGVGVPFLFSFSGRQIHCPNNNNFGYWPENKANSIFDAQAFWMCVFSLSSGPSGVVSPLRFGSLHLPSPTVIPTSIPSPTPLPLVHIGLVGDLGLGRHITSTARRKNDFNWSFAVVSPWLKSNDFNLANLESPIIPNCPEGKTGTFTFCGDDRFLPYLSENRFTLNLANNHIFNYGRDGFSQTIDYLDQHHIRHFYSHPPDFKFTTQTVNGISFGFLGYDFVTNPKFSPKDILSDVRLYDPQVNWLVVSLHWGNEYQPAPEKWRIDLAHQLVDAGADIIHGHHPHVWQPPEIYRQKPIFYSFGNFIFDQSWSYETSHSQIVRLTLSATDLVQTDYYPIAILHNSQPQITD